MNIVERTLVCQNPRCGCEFTPRFLDQRRFCSTACRHNFKYPNDLTMVRTAAPSEPPDQHGGAS